MSRLQSWMATARTSAFAEVAVDILVSFFNLFIQNHIIFANHRTCQSRSAVIILITLHVKTKVITSHMNNQMGVIGHAFVFRCSNLRA